MNITFPSLETTPMILDLLNANAPVCIGVSGGKDSTATSLATTTYLDQIGYQGPRILIHSDLGRVEWRDSLPMCQRLSEHLEIPLIVVRRQAGDLMDRWLVRWRNNCTRYANLECVKLILPWSTASMRFCTSELKTAIICRELVQRFPGQTILSVVGIRRQESPTRAKAPVIAPQPKLLSHTLKTNGYTWHPLLSWTVDDVLNYHTTSGFPLHEAYRIYGSSRVSCCFCILSSHADLLASTQCLENQDVYREIVELEILSTFSFQEKQWLGDVAYWLLDETTHARLAEAKRRAHLRVQAEARIPKHLLYTRGWPTIMPTQSEAVLLSDVRRRVADILEISIEYTAPTTILDRYAELMARRPQQHQALVTSVQHELWNLEVST